MENIKSQRCSSEVKVVLSRANQMTAANMSSVRLANGSEKPHERRIKTPHRKSSQDHKRRSSSKSDSLCPSGSQSEAVKRKSHREESGKYMNESTKLKIATNSNNNYPHKIKRCYVDLSSGKGILQKYVKEGNAVVNMSSEVPSAGIAERRMQGLTSTLKEKRAKTEKQNGSSTGSHRSGKKEPSCERKVLKAARSRKRELYDGIISMNSLFDRKRLIAQNRSISLQSPQKCDATATYSGSIQSPVSVVQKKLDTKKSLPSLKNPCKSDLPTATLSSSLKSGSSAQRRLEKYKQSQEKEKRQVASVQPRTIDTNGLKSETSRICSTPNSTSFPVCFEVPMEIDFVQEQEIHKDILKLRAEEPRPSDSQQSSFSGFPMEVDFENINQKIYIVLDTNILLSHLSFVHRLLDIAESDGKAVLYLPWQVMQELDHLKDFGKQGIRQIARQSINFLHRKLGAKHSGLKGQNIHDSESNDCNLADDNILLACVQLQQKDQQVVLLSNDTNLCNKALLTNIRPFTKYQLEDELKKHTNDIHSVVKSVELEAYTPVTDTSSAHQQQDDCALGVAILNISKETLSKVLSSGMEKQFGSLWKKRTRIPPPWTLSQVVECVVYHWSILCNGFASKDVKDIEAELKRVVISNEDKTLSRSDAKTVVSNVIKLLYRLMFYPIFEKIIKKPLKDLESLQNQLEHSVPEQQKVPNKTETTVLSRFEMIFNSVMEFCNTYIQPTNNGYTVKILVANEKEKASELLSALSEVISPMKTLLSVPVYSLNEHNPAVEDLLSKIGLPFDNESAKNLVALSKDVKTRQMMVVGLQQFTQLQEYLSTICSSMYYRG